MNAVGTGPGDPSFLSSACPFLSAFPVFGNVRPKLILFCYGATCGSRM